jgi:UDP-N-acetylglucosamine 1-carboxyvinyltransferase
MDRIVVRGGARLEGEVRASGSKNSTLALMAATLLAQGESRLSNVPRLRDVDAMLELLGALRCVPRSWCWAR